MRCLRRKEKMGKKIKRGGGREREKRKGKKKNNGTLSAASARKFASTIYSSCPQPPMQNIDRKLTNILYGLLSKQEKKNTIWSGPKLNFLNLKDQNRKSNFKGEKV